MVKRKGSFRVIWINPRLEEKFDCIRRLPPPGNTRQLKITSFLGGNNQSQCPEQPIACSGAGRRTLDAINLAQWNANSLSEAKAHEVSVFAHSNLIDILCISELGHRRTIPGFKPVMVSSKDTQSGIFTRNYLPVESCHWSQLDNFEEQGILTQGCVVDNSFILLHVYIPPRISTFIRQSFWEQVEEICLLQRHTPLTILGDLNTKSPEISEQHTSSVHSYFAQFLEKSDMHILNDSTPTRGCNSLDVTMGNSIFLERVSNWEVVDELDSDHLPVITCTNFMSTTGKKHKVHNTYRYLDIGNTIKGLQCEIKAKRLHKRPMKLGTFHKLLVKNIRYKTSNKPGCVFWSSDLTNLKRKRNAARRKLRHATEDNREVLLHGYREARKEFRKAFRKHKRNFQCLQVQEAATNPHSAKAWELTKAFIPATRRKSKKWVTHSSTAAKEAESIADKFASISADPEIQIDIEHQRRIEEKLWFLSRHSFKAPLISMRELRSSIARTKNKSASGADGITVPLLKAIVNDEFLGKILLSSFNIVLNTSSFPDELKTAKVTPIPKEDTKNYRPISLLPTMGKLLDRIIENKIREQVEDLLHPAQQGCRAAHGTASALTRLFHHAGVASAKDEQQFGIVTFDFSKAYDRVNRHLLISKLMEMKVDTYLILIVNDWLQNRQFFVQHRGVSSKTRPLPNGIPQGSALSVLLWLIYVNDLDVKPQHSNIYVDDVVVWSSAPTRATLLKNLTIQANNVLEWCSRNRVKINYDKTHLLVNGHVTPCKIHIGGHTLSNSRKVRYLGVDLLASPSDSNCSIGYDLHKPAADIRRRCAIIQPLRRLGFSQRQIEIIISGFVGGKLRYYTPWLGADTQDTMRVTLDPLVKAYNQLMRTMCQAIRTTPISLLHAGSRMPLLTSVIQRDCTRLVLSSLAANTILGQEYSAWDGTGDGWTPLGCAWKTLRDWIPDAYKTIQFREKPSIEVLNNMSMCHFNVCKDRKLALYRLEQNQLLVDGPDVEIWTDGSFATSSQEGGSGILIRLLEKENQSFPSQMLNGNSSHETAKRNPGSEIDCNPENFFIDTPNHTSGTRFNTHSTKSENHSSRILVHGTHQQYSNTAQNYELCRTNVHLDKAASPSLSMMSSNTQTSSWVHANVPHENPQIRTPQSTALLSVDCYSQPTCEIPNLTHSHLLGNAAQPAPRPNEPSHYQVVEVSGSLRHAHQQNFQNQNSRVFDCSPDVVELDHDSEGPIKELSNDWNPVSNADDHPPAPEHTYRSQDESWSTSHRASGSHTDRQLDQQTSKPSDPSHNQVVEVSHTCRHDLQQNFQNRKSQVVDCSSDPIDLQNNATEPIQAYSSDWYPIINVDDHTNPPEDTHRSDEESWSTSHSAAGSHTHILMDPLEYRPANPSRNHITELPGRHRSIGQDISGIQDFQPITPHRPGGLSHPILATHDIKLGSHMNNVTSSYDVELEAALEATKATFLLGITGKKIALYSDNRGLITQLQALPLKPKLVDESVYKLVLFLNKLVSNNNQVYITWIPGHVGISGNEAADDLATTNLTRKDIFWYREPRMANYDYFMRRHIISDLDAYLIENVRPSSQSCYPDREWFKGKKINSGTQNSRTVYPYKTEKFHAALFRARTGHSYSRDHLFRFNITEDRTCRYCQEADETIEHLALICNVLDTVEYIKEARTVYHAAVAPEIPFCLAIWTQPEAAQKLLDSVVRHSACL